MADPQAKQRVITVEEHSVTDAHIDAVARLEVDPGEEQERALMDGLQANPEVRGRIVDIDGRLAEMGASGTDVAVLSLGPPGVQFFRGGNRAAALACEMDDRLA